MALGEIVQLSGIPYLAHAALPGRFISSLTFHEGEWRMWLQTEVPDRVEVRAWPAEAFYFARQPEEAKDICSTFLTFMAQRSNFDGFQATFSAIQDDMFNLSASLAKLHLIFESGDKAGSGASRMAATEVEYILLVCRSVFDLLQEVLAKLWGKITLTDTTKRKKALKKTFSDMTLHANTLKSAHQIAAQFQLPEALANCYARHAPIFLKIREFRDNLVHRGHRVQTIFRGKDGFVITKSLGTFLNLNIWRDDEVMQNDLVPLMPALALVVHGTLAACDDFAQVLLTCIQFPNPIVPGMDLFMRGYFNGALVDALADAEQRLAEGRSLIPSPAKAGP
jgi:hypothetical protein